MATTEIRAGLLGAGYIAKWHAEALKRVPNVRLTAVCDLSMGAAEALAGAYGAERAFGSLEEMLDADVCDCIHVLTPPHAHVDAARAIMERGLAAFVEKPFALSSQDCDELAALAKEKNVALGVNHNFLMLPSYDRLKADLKGVVGRPDVFEANWQCPLPPLRSGPFGLWMLRAPENILFEIGPHLFAFVADLFGELNDIEVSLRNPVEIPGGLTHYQSWRVSGEAGGASATLNMSLIEGYDNRSVRVRGLGGLAHYDFAQDVYRREVASMEDIVVGPLAMQLSLVGQALNAGAANAVRQFTSLNALSPYGLSITRAAQRFYDALTNKTPVDKRLSPELAATATRMIEAALEKARPHFAPPAAAPAITFAAPEKDETMLVIGGTGFIGRALTDALADKGYKVRVFSRGGAAGLERADGRVEVFTGSLKSDDDLARAMEGVDGVFHLARASETSWQGYLDNDVAVTRRIGEACLAAGVKRLVYTGTIDSYDASQPDRPITEETPFDPDLEQRNLYARSKAACEAALEALAAEKGLPLTIARPGIVIGKGGPLQHWGIAMWRGATACKLWGKGDNIMPFVLVDDVADGLVLSMEAAGAEGRSFNLIGEPMLSARDYFNAVGESAGVKMRARPTPIWSYFAVDLAKYWAKRLLARRSGLTKPSLRDWKSRAQLSPYVNAEARQSLGWRPEADRARFIERGIASANLFGTYPYTKCKDD